MDAWVDGVGCWVEGAGLRVEGVGLRVQVVGFRVQCVGFRVQGSGFRVQESGFGVRLKTCRSEPIKAAAAWANRYHQSTRLDQFVILEPFPNFDFAPRLEIYSIKTHRLAGGCQGKFDI